MRDFGSKIIRKPGTAAQAGVAEKKPKRVEEGIRYAKWQSLPTCCACGLEDGGKDASARPTEIHHLECINRKLMPLPMIQTQTGYENGRPVFELRPRSGTFKGEAIQRQYRYPFRKMLRLPARDPITLAAIPGKYFFFCEYYWKTAMVVDFVWDGAKWLPWYKFSKLAKSVADRSIPDAAREVWMGMFFRNRK